MKYSEDFINFLKGALEPFNTSPAAEAVLTKSNDEAKEELYENWLACEAGKETFISSDLLELWATYFEFKYILDADPEKAKSMMIELKIYPEKFLGLISVASYGLGKLAEDIISDYEEEKKFLESFGEDNE